MKSKILIRFLTLGCEDNRENWNALAESRPPPGNNQSQPRTTIVTNQSESKTVTKNNQLEPRNSADNQSESRSESGNQSESSDKVQSHKSAPPGESNAG